MDKGASSWDDTTGENLLVVEDNGRILSRRVSKVYGKALLGAMALPKSSSPVTDLHVSFLSDHEPLTMNTIKIAARTVAPGDNFMFVDDSRRIVSCRINPDYGVMLLERMPQDAYQTHSVLFQPTVTQARATNNQAIISQASQHISEELHQSDMKASSSPPSTARTHVNNLGILSDEILSSANGQPYDRDWMNRYSISEECLKGSPSKHTLGMLVRHGAIRVGDELCVTYYPGGGPVVKVGKVLQSLKTGRLDLRVAPIIGRDSDRILHGCGGPKAIISGMDEEFRMKHHARASEAWKAVNVVSDDGRAFGSLWEVRQAYQVFTEQMAEWSARDGTKRLMMCLCSTVLF